MKLGAWQMVLWQPRWVYAEVDGFCYQKISTTEARARLVVDARAFGSRRGVPASEVELVSPEL